MDAQEWAVENRPHGGTGHRGHALAPDARRYLAGVTIHVA